MYSTLLAIVYTGHQGLCLSAKGTSSSLAHYFVADIRYMVLAMASLQKRTSPADAMSGGNIVLFENKSARRAFIKIWCMI